MMHPINEKIRAFLEEHQGADYTFAHIVLGDGNLGDEDIRFCLSNEVIIEWMERQIAEYRDLEGPAEGWEPFELHWCNLIREAGEIASFLHELWRMPEEERIAAENEGQNDTH